MGDIGGCQKDSWTKVILGSKMNWWFPSWFCSNVYNKKAVSQLCWNCGECATQAPPEEKNKQDRYRQIEEVY